MVVPGILDTLSSSLFGVTGDFTMVSLGIIGALLIAFLFAGLDFKFALMFTSPVIWGLASVGWLPQWTKLLATLFIIGFGLILVMSRFRGER